MEEGRRRKKWKRFCYDSVLFHRVKQGNQTQVMNEVDTGASGSSCGGGGGGVGGEGYKKEWRNQGNGAEKRQQRGWASFFLSECLPRHLQSLQEKVQAQKSSILAFPQCCNLSIWIIAPVSEFCRYQQRRCLPPFELRRNKRPRVGGALRANQ